MDTITTLPGLLQSIIAGVATVPVVNWLLARASNQFNKGQKRIVAVVSAFVLGIVATLLMVWLGYIPTPATMDAWAETVWPAMLGAFTASQVILSALRSETMAKWHGQNALDTLAQPVDDSRNSEDIE